MDRVKFNFLSYILLTAIIFSGLTLLVLEVKASASATATLTITNSLPIASGVSINSAAASMALTESGTATATVTFAVNDNNGCEDINSNLTNKTKVVFYRTNVDGGAACTPNNANCYVMTCTGPTGCISGGADLDATFSCTASVQYYADPTDTGSTYEANEWTATAIPRDSAGTDGTTGTDTIEMNSLTALSVTSSINYSSLALASNTGSTDQTTIVTNTGNRAIDTQVGGYGSTTGDTHSMSCTIGSIPVANEKYSITPSTDYASKTALKSDTPSPDTVATNIAKGASSNTGNIYWGMGLPENGVGGTCTGHVVFTAVDHV